MTIAVDGSFGPLAGTAAELARGVESGLQLGGQLFVSSAGETVADAAFGEARPGEPMRRDHWMLWLSSTKPVAAVAIAQLWERGALALDDPVARHLPEFAPGGKAAITVRHLLTHTSGIRMLDTGWPAASWDETIARICARPIEPRWVPGRKAGYHLASSWFVLGELVRRIDGRPFERYVREELFGPLGMPGCWIGMPREVRALAAGRIAPLYAVESGGLVESDLTSEAKLVAPSPGGNGVGPIGELARFYAALARGGELDGRRVLRTQTVEALVARHRVGLVDQTFETRLDWGLGVIVDSKHYGDAKAPYGYGPYAGPRTWGHSGARSSTAFVDPDAGLVVALAVNGMPDDETHRDRFARLTAAIYVDLGLAGGV
ncbi:MAG TPA: serine hydrolase domain-containing protein [Thermoanaerobaculia bacterium]|nr:serine hydrolase domain-containing protein [Thermoanaerobaculia bacterium]